MTVIAVPSIINVITSILSPKAARIIGRNVWVGFKWELSRIPESRLNEINRSSIWLVTIETKIFHTIVFLMKNNFVCHSALLCRRYIQQNYICLFFINCLTLTILSMLRPWSIQINSNIIVCVSWNVNVWYQLVLMIKGANNLYLM